MEHKNKIFCWKNMYRPKLIFYFKSITSKTIRILMQIQGKGKLKSSNIFRQNSKPYQ